MFTNVKHFLLCFTLFYFVWRCYTLFYSLTHMIHSVPALFNFVADGFLVTALSDRVSTAIAGHRRPTPSVRVHHLVAVRGLLEHSLESRPTPRTTSRPTTLFHSKAHRSQPVASADGILARLLRIRPSAVETVASQMRGKGDIRCVGEGRVHQASKPVVRQMRPYTTATPTVGFGRNSDASITGC